MNHTKPLMPFYTVCALSSTGTAEIHVLILNPSCKLFTMTSTGRVTTEEALARCEATV